MSDGDYCEKLIAAIKKEDQCSIESLWNLPGGTWTIERLLLKNKLDPNIQGNPKGHALVHWAARANNPDILEVLCVEKTNIDIKNKNGCTALSFAVAQAKVQATKVLLDRGADPNIVNEEYHASLHSALKGYFSMGTSYKANYLKIIVLLIENLKTSVNKPDREGKTPLHYAVIFGCTKIVKLLLSCQRIDLGIKDRENKTALDYARKKGINELIELLSSNKQK